MNAGGEMRMTKLALLIDGDNVSDAFMPLIMREANELGVVAIRRLYGQFASGRMKSWQKLLAEYDLTAVNVAPLTRGKNATDMKLVIEAMDMLHSRRLDGFCIASSDGDFTPLAIRIRANALAVYGFGAKKAPAGYKAEFDRFYECDTLLAAEKKGVLRRAPATDAKPSPAAAAATAERPSPSANTATAAPAAAPRGRGRQQMPPKLPIPTIEILAAIDAAREADGWSLVSSVSNHVRKAIKDFTPKRHGYSTLKRLIAAMPEAESHTTPDGTPFARRRAASRAAPRQARATSG